MNCPHCLAGYPLVGPHPPRTHQLGQCLMPCTEPQPTPLLCDCAAHATEIARLRAELTELRARVAELEGQRRAVDEALNADDGMYRP